MMRIKKGLPFFMIGILFVFHFTLLLTACSNFSKPVFTEQAVYPAAPVAQPAPYLHPVAYERKHRIWCYSNTSKRIPLDNVIAQKIREAFSGGINIKNCTFYEGHEDHFIYTFDINEHQYHLKCPISLNGSKGKSDEQCEVISHS